MAVDFSLINTEQDHIQEHVNYAELKPIITATGLSRAYVFRLKGPCVTLHRQLGSTLRQESASNPPSMTTQTFKVHGKRAGYDACCFNNMLW